jgi:hypothetical protein
MAKTANQTWLPALTYSGHAQIDLGGKTVELNRAS